MSNKTPDLSAGCEFRVASGTSSCFFLLHRERLLLTVALKQPLELRILDRIRLYAIRKVGNSRPPALGEHGSDLLCRFPARLVAIEHDGDERELGGGVPEGVSLPAPP